MIRVVIPRDSTKTRVMAGDVDLCGFGVSQIEISLQGNSKAKLRLEFEVFEADVEALEDAIAYSMRKL